jgi:GNAT superfamily N-acetyltransferase
MSIDTEVSPAAPKGAIVVVRPARRSDHRAIRRVVRDAYGEYAAQLPREVFHRYLQDLVDLDRHARLGTLLVAELDGCVSGSVVFYPDASVQGMGWPAGWAGIRAVAVHREARHQGVARALLTECERLARSVEAPVLAFHTAPFMTRALALYDQLGFVRLRDLDLDITDLVGSTTPIRIVALARFLTTRSHRTERSAP